MKKYKTGSYDTRIEEYEVVKETAHRVTFKKESKHYLTGIDQIKIDTENKSSNYHQWHDSFENAKQFLVERALKGIAEREKQISKLREDIIKIEYTKLNN